MAKAKTWSRGATFEQPEGKIRRSQVVSTFGPGAMVDLVDQAVLISGLDHWQYPKGQPPPVLPEPRLRQTLAERLQAVGRSLHPERPFLQPPVGNNKEPSRQSGIPALEFPKWFVCQNPACRALVRFDGLIRKEGRYLHECDHFRRTECVPVRFVTACRRGHLQEFPWVWFAHRRVGASCAAPSLRLLEGASGDFSEVVVRCLCKAEERLSSAMVKGALPDCHGERPWLGPEGREDCANESLRLMVRSASNGYFPQVESAISIPDPGGELQEAVESNWGILEEAAQEDLPSLRKIATIKRALADYTDAEVLAAVEAKRLCQKPALEPIRTAEFRQLVAQKEEIAGELPRRSDIFFARSHTPPGGLPAKVARLALVRKLREVRVQVGFTRIEPVTPDLQGEYDLGVQSASLSLTEDWLPASEILGEGFFVQLDEGAVRKWEDRPAVRKREGELRAGHTAWTQTLNVKPPPIFPGIRFYLLHSLSHLLLSAVSLECGYAASAIRERIYCAPAGADVPMAGILLYTGTPGTEGTLGGLVEQGKKLGSHLSRALDLGRLCSNDPVCAAHTPDRDPSERFLEGAACHGCLFLAECSCERFNRYLDRALVVPSLEHDPELAFF
jgi:hypothetical protein